MSETENELYIRYTSDKSDEIKFTETGGTGSTHDTHLKCPQRFGWKT